MCGLRIIPSHCPICGDPARGTLENLQGWAMMLYDDEHRDFEYDGYTKVLWDTQRTDVDDGMVTVICELRHAWQARTEG